MKFLSFILTQSWRNLHYSWGLQLMTMLTVTLSVLIFSFFYLVYANMLQAGNRLGDELRLIVYLDSAPSPEQQQIFVKKVKSFNPVEKIEFITPDQAFTQLGRQLGQDRDVLDDLTPQFLPHSVEIYPKRGLKNLARIKEFSDYLKTLPGATKVQYGHGWVQRFGHFTQLLRFVVVLSGTLLILTTIFMVSYTLRLSLYSRQQELKVLRYLGATNSYIKGPVFIEGFMLGLTGSALGITSLYFLFQWIKGHFSGPGFMNFFEFTFLPTSHAVIILVSSILLCTLGSLLSIRKFLRI